MSKFRSIDEIFGSEPPQEGQVQMLKISDLRPYPNQPFRPYAPEALAELSEDIAKNGVLSPIIVRKQEITESQPYTHYQILAGHNRVNAAKMARLESVPAIVKDVSDNDARLIMVNTNLNQRQQLLPSEKAFAYKIQMESLSQMGKKSNLLHNVQKVESTKQFSADDNLLHNVQKVESMKQFSVDDNLLHNVQKVESMKQFSADDNLLHIVQKVDTSKNIADQSGESKRNIAYYIRLTFLIPPLLDMVDDEKLPFRAGVELSYISEEEQQILYKYIVKNRCKISLLQAEEIKRYSLEMDTIANVLDKIFGATGKAQIKAVKLNSTELYEYIPQQYSSKKEIESFLIEAVKFYRKNG